MRATVFTAMALLLGAFLVGVAEPASGEKKQVCSVCGEAVGSKPVQLKAQGTHLYHCIFCALVDGQHRGDCTITARSASGEKTVTLSKQGRTWKVSPATALALSLSSPPNRCEGRHLAFASREEFDAYLKSHPDVAKQKPKPIPLARVTQVLDAGRPPIPEEAACPVMRRTFAPDSKTVWTIKGGKAYYFCCAGCAPHFK